MSLRTFQRMTMVGVLALGAFATGCDEDTTEPTTDAGKTEDSGSGEADAEVDSGPVVKPGKQCGATFCEKGKAVLGQCCVDDGDVCGIDLAAPGMASMGCFPENAPGVASAHCGTVLDMFEAENKVPGKFEIPAGMLTITVPTCCTPAGTCGVQGNESTAGNLGVGCLDVAALAPAPAADGGMPAGPALEIVDMKPNGLPLIPNTFCDAATGAAGCIPLKPRGPDGPTAPPFLLGACKAEVKAGCILGVEKNIHGCGTAATDNWNRKNARDGSLCVDGIEKTVFGCDPITLANYPSIVCGCGAGKTALGTTPQLAALPCFADTAESVCGKNFACTGVATMAMPSPVDSCAGPDSCADLAPFTSAKDGVGDGCGCNPAVDLDGPGPGTDTIDSCDPGGLGFFDCLPVPMAGNRCSCGTVGAKGTCADGSICTDTDMNMIGDTCKGP